MKKRRSIILRTAPARQEYQPLCSSFWKGKGEDLPAETPPHPTQPQRPARGRVAAQRAPGEDEGGREWFSDREGCEED